MQTVPDPRHAAPRWHDSLRLGETEFPYELVLENTIVGVGYMLERRFLWANARMAQIYGYEPGELDDQSVRILYCTQSDYEEVGRMYAVMAQHGGYTHEHPQVRKDGSLIWCLISGRLIRPDDPRSPSVWVVQDISDRKRAEDQLRRTNQRLEHRVARRTLNLHRSNVALRAEVERRRAAQLASAQSREKYRALFRHMPLGVLVTDAAGEIVEFNRTLQRYFGAASRAAFAAIKEEPRVMQPDGAVQSLAALLRGHAQSSQARRVDRFELVWLAAGSERRDHLVVAAPMSGRDLGVAYVFSDVTEARRARDRAHEQEAALAHAARLSLMGQMASALAHQLGQPLNACQSYLGGLQHRIGEELADRPEWALAIDKAIHHLDQAGEIIRSVRGFVTRHQPQTEQTDLLALVQQTLGLLDPSLRAAGARVNLNASAAMRLSLRCHVVEIQQVLVNLVMNALDAVQTGGDERLIEITLATDGHSKATVEVADSGHGVPAELAERIFEPYFTTKSSGLGMGLMICRTIVESHGGSLRLVAGPSHGACFRFTLPLARESSQ